VRRELAGRAVSVGQGAKVLFGAWIWPEARDVEEGLRPDWGKGAILGVPMGGCFSQEEHRLQSRPGLCASAGVSDIVYYWEVYGAHGGGLALLALKFGCELIIFLLVFVKSAEEAAKGWILIRIIEFSVWKMGWLV